MINALPRYSELTSEQQRLVEIGADKSMVVSAAPGTGKTVMAIYRAGQLSRMKKKVALLVYNKPLMLYIDAIAKKQGFTVEVNTWHSWLTDFYKKTLKKTKPVITGPFDPDWIKIKTDFAQWSSKPVNASVKYDSVIMDEAQDFPIELIESIKLISKSMICFMDPNQSIDNKKTDIDDVIDIVGGKVPFTFNENFRNHKEIFDFAGLYRSQSDVDSHAQPAINEYPILEKVSGTAISFDKVYRAIDSHKVPYIGVFVESKKLNQTYENLESRYPGRVYMYKPMSEFAKISFEKPGIYILSYACMKGLEFDKVIMPKYDSIESKRNTNTDMNIIYVAITRSEKYFHGIYRNDTNSQFYIDTMKPFRENPRNRKLVRMING